mmetsp:Transcript_1268/g.3720  ORF Transcript_1268/g.3720 Transcript_1268/m.3720 type:complete len:121 (-) Transcript_1268:231-593(-)
MLKARNANKQLPQTKVSQAQVLEVNMTPKQQDAYRRSHTPMDRRRRWLTSNRGTTRGFSSSFLGFNNTDDDHTSTADTFRSTQRNEFDSTSAADSMINLARQTTRMFSSATRQTHRKGHS